MLKSLQIQDYALIEKIFIQFGNGLNIITGETGAGKSILVDAMSLLLGERASSEVIRKNAQKTVVEGIFDAGDNYKVKELLEMNEIEFLEELIMRREISLKGSNRCFINDTPVSLSLIKDVGNYLVDFHGQHEHQSLLKSETHIEMLDDFGNFNNDLEEFIKQKYGLFLLFKDIKSLREKEKLLIEKKELYSFQIKEIDSVAPFDNEDEKLTDELKILENSEKLLELSGRIYLNLYDSDEAVYNSLVKIRNDLNNLTVIDKSFAGTRDEFESVLTILKDISEFIRSYKEKIDLEPDHLENVRDRLSALNFLKRKYGGSIKHVLEFREKIGEEFSLAENFSQRIADLEKEINIVRKSCGKIAAEISKKRKEISKKIKKEVVTELKSLGIPDAEFDVNISRQSDDTPDYFVIYNDEKYKINNRGFDEVEFFISMNKGEDFKPLAKVASGGEVSRIMLALKSVLAKSDKLPILIFDEIDTGVSGRIARKVGENLNSLASFHQIIAITHLPQIAGFADHHYHVEKVLSGNRVISSIKKLSNEERVYEIARLLSGEKITAASLKTAKELLTKG